MKLKRLFKKNKQPSLSSRSLQKQGSTSSGETEPSQGSSHIVQEEIRVIVNAPDSPDKNENLENREHSNEDASFWSGLWCFLPSEDPVDEAKNSRIRDGKGGLPKIECVYDEAESTKAQLGCKCQSKLPPLDPKMWPQAPLLLRPRPNSGTRIVGIRRDAGVDYLWEPGMEKPWWHTLQDEWDSTEKNPEEVAPFCECCVILPINNGNETQGESLVADFETELFHGSLMLRLRHAEGTTKEASDDSKGFFSGVPFRYQATIRGKFKENLPWTELMTGTRLDRRPGKTPPKWLMWTALKVVHFFAPQLQTRLDCDRPYSVSPLGSAPRTVSVNDGEPSDLLGDDREEPTTPENSLTGKAYPIKDALERARARKKHFDKMFGSKEQKLMTGEKTYTFQFLQHMFDYKTTSIDLGNFHHDMNELLDGQPLQLMAEHDDSVLWAFEIWNEIILDDAKKHINT